MFKNINTGSNNDLKKIQKLQKDVDKARQEYEKNQKIYSEQLHKITEDKKKEFCELLKLKQMHEERHNLFKKELDSDDTQLRRKALNEIEKLESTIKELKNKLDKKKAELDKLGESAQTENNKLICTETLINEQKKKLNEDIQEIKNVNLGYAEPNTLTENLSGETDLSVSTSLSIEQNGSHLNEIKYNNGASTSGEPSSNDRPPAYTLYPQYPNTCENDTILQNKYEFQAPTELQIDNHESGARVAGVINTFKYYLGYDQ